MLFSLWNAQRTCPMFCKQRLTVVLGEENAAHILALMAQVGEEGEQIVMLLIAEIVRRDEQVQGVMRPLNTCAASSLDKSESGMKIRIRGSYRRGKIPI